MRPALEASLHALPGQPHARNPEPLDRMRELGTPPAPAGTPREAWNPYPERVTFDGF
jgi:hypothetical protein